VNETGQPYAYTGDDPVNGTDPLGLWSLNPVSDVEQAAGDVHHDADDVGHFLKDPNRWRAEADYAAGIGNAIASTVTLGHVHISAPYCGYELASDVGGVIGTGLTLVLGGAVGEGLKVVQGAETLEEAEATVQAAETSNTARGLSKFGGIFSSEENAAGGTIYTSEGDISQSDFASMVNTGLMKGDVNIISGVHGFSDATMSADQSLYLDDVRAFGNIPGVTVYNLPDLNPGEISDLLNGPGTTIGGFCNSGACLAPFK
jgi:hypothetical protein